MAELDIDNSIAIIGMACRFPGANSIDEFWQNLRNGVESVTYFSEEELLASGINEQSLSNPDYVRAGTIIKDIDQFDGNFFKLNAFESQVIDPQQRLLIECAWEALEVAGYPPSIYGKRIGVYVGARISEYLLFNQPLPDLAGLDLEPSSVSFQRLLGNDKDYLATRISYLLNLKGPSITVQTACSTSLVAVHIACQSLLNGECDLALAGGASVRVPQKAGYL